MNRIFKVGDMVTHINVPNWGDAVVVSVGGERDYIIKFKDHGNYHVLMGALTPVRSVRPKCWQ